MRLMTITDNVDNRVITVDQETGTSGRKLFAVRENLKLIDRKETPFEARELALAKYQAVTP